MTLTEELRASIEPIYARILEHPFVRGLGDGSLPEDAFRFYVVQDALYLREFARALALAAARAPREPEILLFARHAADAIEVERALHAGFLRELGVGGDETAAAEPAPTCAAYASFLLAVTYGGSWPEALGALLPCYWIYRDVGEELLARGSPHPLYRRWIETYSGEEFARSVRAAIDALDGVAGELGETERRRVAARFVTAARYEWMFWEMGWRRERWPV